MKQYISKSALVAEIERINKKVGTPPQENSNGEDWPFKAGEQHVCHEIISIINSLEVKKVDFDAEWKKYFEHRGDMATVNIKHLAKYFFELGLKAQKGDK